MTDFFEIAHQWFDAFNNKDIDALIDLYDDDAEHYSPKLKISQPHTKGWIKGSDALRAWWNDAFERMPQLHYEIIKLMKDNEQVFMEYMRQNPGEPDLRVGEVLNISNGKIVMSRVYHS
ncbi:MAG: nuclear transport factor 2 family protein [Bacteroidetes bacterium]|nr:nuclear transport factor 2 family protein [Bacteroidota bacterium]